MMWRKQQSSAVTLSLSIAIFLTPMATLLKSKSTLAESTKTESSSPSLTVPEAVPVGTNLRIGNSSSMALINQALKKSFEEKYPNATVETSSRGADTALKALLDEKIDLAAIGRPLTAAEKAEGLVEVPVGREKIAMIVGPDNPFNGSITYTQFVKIFRGEITDWSQIGGPKGKIRLIDRPETSDTRQALQNYRVFQEQEFTTGSNATQLQKDDTKKMIKTLGKDGIGYAIANQVFKKDGVQVLPIHQVSPENTKYPFSQPLVYVYKKTPTPAISSFLDFATSEAGQKTIQDSSVFTGAAILATAKASAAEAVGDKDATPETTAQKPEKTTDGITTKLTQANNPETSPTEKSTVTSLAATKLTQANNPETSPTKTATKANLGVSSNTKNDANLTTTAIYAATNPNGSGVVTEDKGENVESATGDVIKAPAWLWWLMLLPLSGIFIVLQLAKSASASTDTSNTVKDVPVAGGASDSESQTVGDTNSAAILDNSASPVNASGINTTANTETAKDIQSAVIANESLTSSTTTQPENISSPGEAVVGGYADSAEHSTSSENADNSVVGISDQIGIVNPQLSSNIPPVAPPNSTAETTTAAPLKSSNLNVADAAVAAAGLGVLGVSAFAGDAASDCESETVKDTHSAAIVDNSADAANPSGINTTANIETVKDTDSAAIVDNSADVANASGINTTANTETAKDIQSAVIANESLTSSTTTQPENISSPGEAVVGGYADSAEHSTSSENADNSVVSVSDQTATANPQPSSNIPPVAPPNSTEETTTAATLKSPNLNVADAAVVAAGFGVLGVSAFAGDAASETAGDRKKSQIEAAKFNIGQNDDGNTSLATVDVGLPELPDGYGESYIVLMPRNPEWAYVYWQILNEDKEKLLGQGGIQLALRLYDVTDIDASRQTPHSMEQFECEESAKDWYLPIPMSDRDYIVDIGYVTGDGDWLLLARSASVRIPPLYPSDWHDDKFIKVSWDEKLDGSKTFLTLVPPDRRQIIYENGSLLASPKQLPQFHPQAIPSGIGMSGVGFLASDVSNPSSSLFWLFTDANLIVYGAAQPNTKVTINGESVKLNPDGSFGLKITLQESLMEYHVMAVAADGSKTESINLKLSGETHQYQVISNHNS